MANEATITVTAVKYKPDNGSSGFAKYTYADPSLSYSGGGSSAAASPPSSVNPPGEITVVGSVNVRVDDPAHLEEAKSAAENVAIAIVEIKEQLDANPNLTYSYRGCLVSASELRGIIDNTQFIIDDRAGYNNLGVGAAQRGVNGSPNIDRLNYHQFSSAAFNPSGYGADGYAGQGVRAMVLHELMHFTNAAADLREDSLRWHRREGGNNSNYASSPYVANDESFVHEMQNAMAVVTGIPVDRYEAAVSAANSFTVFREPEVIYNSRNPRGGA